MSKPLLSVYNNNFHPAITAKQVQHVKRAILALNYAKSELHGVHVNLKELNLAIKGRGGVRLIELDTAIQFVHAYEYILTNTLEIKGAGLEVECESCKGRGWFPCGSVAGGRSKCGKCGGLGVVS